MKKIIIILIIIHQVIFAQDITLTLEESIELGIKNSKELNIANSNLIKADEAISEATSQMLPKFSLNASYARLSEVSPFNVDLPILPQPITIQEAILDNLFLSASFNQPLFTGFRLSSLRNSAKLNSKAESINYEKEKILKIDEIQKAFWKYYIAKQITHLVKENLSAINSHLENTIIFLNNGLVTKNDLLKIRVEAGNIELHLLDAKNNENLARSMFNKTIGLPLDMETNILAEGDITSLNIGTYQDLLNYALTNRQEIKSLQYKRLALEEKEQAVKADRFPQIFAFGNFYYSNPNQRYLPLEEKFNDSWDVGIAVKWDIWNWGGTSAKVEQSYQDSFQAEEFLKMLKENIELDVYKNYLSLQKSLKKIELSKLQVESAEENNRITIKKYNQQLATSTDLIDAEAALINAKTTLLTSKVEYKIENSSLNKTIGKIVE